MKTVVITGATSGIGFATSKLLASQGWRVIAVGRTQNNCEAAQASIKDAFPATEIVYFWGDLSRQREVARIAEQIAGYLDENNESRLDVLINNAGGVRNTYTPTEDGYELQFALNHLAGFLLTHHLLQYLQKGGGRMILTGSVSHKHMKIHWHDIMYKKRYSCLMAYKQSKLCNMLFAKEFNDRLAANGVKAYVVDPGLVNTDIGNKQTSGIVNWFWSMRKRRGRLPEVAAQTYAFLCNCSSAPDGFYYRDSQSRRYSKQADNREAARKLFELSERLCGIKFGRTINEG